MFPGNLSTHLNAPRTQIKHFSHIATKGISINFSRGRKDILKTPDDTINHKHDKILELD